MTASSTALEQSGSGAADGSSQILKSGPLFISSKALGWKSWKKRWFILTKTSLVFFRSDPSITVQEGGEVSLTLGGIDLNNSGSVIVREDKRLLTILFPGGEDGRGFTLKTETSEDLHEWRTALENAFMQAPCAAPVIMKDGIIIDDVVSGSFYDWKEIHSAESRDVGGPISLALQEADGGPSFLEKALCFLEEFGSKVEGILRISADVEEVQRRIQEFEQGKTEFEANEDAHLVGDCVKHIIRELPTSPVPIFCCNELLKAYEIDPYEAKVKAFRVTILKNLPRPNQLLLQRILKMMYTISCTPENHMTPSAVAACMSPLLLRPILAGECKDDVKSSEDDAAQFFAAANAARTAQAIITSMLEEYHYIFSDENSNRFSISADSEEDEGDEGSMDAEILKKKNIGNVDARNIFNGGQDENPEPQFSEELGRSRIDGGSDLYDNMVSSPNSSVASGSFNLSSSESQHAELKRSKSNGSQLRKLQDQVHGGKKMTVKLLNTLNISAFRKPNLSSPEAESCAEKSTGETASSLTRTTTPSLLERVSAKKICSAESVDSHATENLDVKQLEMKMKDLQRRLAKEARVNESLQTSLERRKQELLERRSRLHQDVEKLQEHFKAEREVGLSRNMSAGKLSNRYYMARAEQEEIAIAESDVARFRQKIAELHHQLSQQQDLYSVPSGAPYQNQHAPNAKPRRRSLRQDFDATLTSVNNEKMPKTHGTSSLSNRRTVEGTQSAFSSRNQMDRRELVNSMNINNSETREVSYNGTDDASPPYRDYKPIINSLESSSQAVAKP